MKRELTKWFGVMGVLASYVVGCSGSDSDDNLGDEDDSVDASGGSDSGGSKSSDGGSKSSDGGSKGDGGSKSGDGGSGKGGSGNGGSGKGGSGGSMDGTGGSKGGSDSKGSGGSMEMGGMGGMLMGGAPNEEPEEPEEPEGPEPGLNYLENGSFEMGTTDKLAEIPGWDESEDEVASFLEAGGRTGAQKLSHWKEWKMNGDWYQIWTSQTLESIPNGTYTFSVWVMRDQWFDNQYLYATGFDDDRSEMMQDTSDGMSSTEFVKVSITGIEVKNNQITVGIYSGAPAGVWANFDDASLTGE